MPKKVFLKIFKWNIYKLYITRYNINILCIKNKYINIISITRIYTMRLYIRGWDND